jgi:hypothetical protein
MTTPPLPEQIELHRDSMWRRDEDLRIESAVDAERFIEDVPTGLNPISNRIQPCEVRLSYDRKGQSVWSCADARDGVSTGSGSDRVSVAQKVDLTDSLPGRYRSLY